MRQYDKTTFVEGRVFEPITYRSGRRAADTGERVQVEVGPTTFFVYLHAHDDLLELIYTTQDRDWMMEHVVL